MAGKYIINQTAGKRVIILDEDADKVEGGYFDTDGTWHDFGGESGITPTLKIKLENNNSNSYNFGGSALQVVNNNKVTFEEKSINPGETESIEVLVIGEEEDGEIIFYFSSFEGKETVSDLVNCTFDDDEYAIIITDPSQNASVTVVIPVIL